MNGWTAIRGNDVTYVQPGDIIHVSGHAAMVYYLDGDIIYVAEAWGSQNSIIKYGLFNGNYQQKGSTLDKLKANYDFQGVWRYGGNVVPIIEKEKPTWAKVVTQDNRTVFSVTEQVNFKLNSDYGKYYNIKINYGDENIVDTTMDEGYDSYCYAFNFLGDYTVCVTAYNEYGSATSETVSFKVVEDYEKPTWAKLYTQDNITDFHVGEKVQFSMDSDNAQYYVIGIDCNGERVKTQVLEKGCTDYSYELNETGSYNAYVSAYNGIYWVDSNIIELSVHGKPTWAKVVTQDNRNVFSVTEQVNFKLNSDYGKYYNVKINYGDENIVDTTMDEGYDSYCYAFNFLGDYTVCVTAYNEYGSATSETVSFKVVEDYEKPTWAKLYTQDNITDFHVGEKVQFSMDSDNAQYYVIGIDCNGERVKTQVLEKGCTDYSYELNGVGSYSAYVSAYNGIYWVDSNIIEFKVGYVLAAPDLKIDVKGQYVTFSWNLIENATHYDVRIWNTDGTSYKDYWGGDETQDSLSVILPAFTEFSVAVCSSNKYYKHCYTYCSNIIFKTGISGDINSDHRTTVADIVLLQKYILGSEEFTKEQFESADINQDNRVDVFDMVFMRKMLIS